MRWSVGLLSVCVACSGRYAAQQQPAQTSGQGSGADSAPVSRGNAIRSDYLRYCEQFAGVVEAWQVHAPSAGGPSDLETEVPRCRWQVVNAGGEIRAVVDASPRPAIRLPFQPSWRPTLQLGSDESDGSPPPLLDVADVLQLPEGYLVAYDSGEWGGALLFFGLDGTYRETLGNANTVQLRRTAYGVLAFTGLAHGTEDFGRVLFLRHERTQWTTTSRELPGAPLWVTPDIDGSLLVITTHDLVRVHEGPLVESLHQGHWAGRSPNSLVIGLDGSIYLGFDYVVIRLRPNASGFDEAWLAHVIESGDGRAPWLLTPDTPQRLD